MKASNTLFERFRGAIMPCDTAEMRKTYREGRFSRAAAVKDLDMRYRWDLLWLLDRHLRAEIMDAAYAEGLNDNHIDTVLRKIVSPL